MAANVTGLFAGKLDVHTREACVLVVDALPGNRSTTASFLSSHLYNVIAAANTGQAIAALKENPVDLIVVDISTSTAELLELIQKVRSEFSRAELPILVIGEQDNGVEFDSGIRSGANEYIARPVDFSKLIVLVNSLTFPKNKRSAMEHSTRTVEHHDPQSNDYVASSGHIDVPRYQPARRRDLHDRQELEEALDQLLEHGCVDDTRHVLCYVDIEPLDLVRSTHGDVAAESLATHIESLLADLINPSDLLARIEHDRFALIFHDCDVHKAGDRARQIRSLMLEQEFQWGEDRYGVVPSIGVVTVRDGSGGITGILTAADAACSIAKRKSVKGIYVYDSGETTLLRRRRR